MNARTVKNNKKNNISGKSIAFWSVIGVVVLTLLVILVIRIFQIKDINSYDKLDSVIGSEIFTQDEEDYFVLFYDYSNDPAMETFDKTMFKYLTFYRDNNKRDDVLKIYKADSKSPVNSKCLGSNSNINNTTKFPNSVQQTGSDTLQIIAEDIPILLIIKNGKVVDHEIGETAILTYLNVIINK